MRGMNGAMRKKPKQEADMFINSNIVISMDDKKRMRSHYQKKHSENMYSKQVIDYSQRVPAGVTNFHGQVNGGQVVGGHINQSRRRILNDFTQSPDRQNRNGSVEHIVNRNLNEALRTNNQQTMMLPSRYDLSNQKSVMVGPGYSAQNQME